MSDLKPKPQMSSPTSPALNPPAKANQNVSEKYLKKSEVKAKMKFNQLMQNYETNINQQLDQLGKNIDFVNNNNKYNKKYDRSAVQSGGIILPPQDRRARRVQKRDSSRHVQFKLEDEDISPDTIRTSSSH